MRYALRGTQVDGKGLQQRYKSTRRRRQRRQRPHLCAWWMLPSAQCADDRLAGRGGASDEAADSSGWMMVEAKWLRCITARDWFKCIEWLEKKGSRLRVY